jgi:hypothetical protein
LLFFKKEGLAFISSHLSKLPQIDRAALAGKRYGACMAMLLRDAVYTVIAAIVCRELPVLLNQQARFFRKEGVAHAVLGTAGRGLSKLLGPPKLAA